MGKLVKHALGILLGLALLAALWHLHGYHSEIGRLAASHTMHKPDRLHKMMPLPTLHSYKNNTGRTKEEEEAYVTSVLCNRTDAKVPADLLPHTMHSWKKSKACVGDPMLVLVRSGHKEVHERVPRIEDTWARKVPKNVKVEAMFDAGSNGPNHGAPVEDFFHDSKHFPKLDLIDWRLDRIEIEKCKEYEKKPPLLQCCKTAEMLWYARLRADRHNANWIFIVDDDAYVFLDNLQLKMCEEYDAAKKTPTAFGVAGCAKDSCAGFCGGGGIGFSRVGLEKLLEGESQQDKFIEKFMATCNRCGQWDDISVGVIAREKGLAIQTLPGLHPWRMSPEQQALRMLSKTEMPLIWHYMRANMYQAHQLRIWAGAAPLLLHFADAHGTFHGKGTDHPHDCLTWSHARSDQVSRDPRGEVRRILGVRPGVYNATVYTRGAGCLNKGISLGSFPNAEACLPSAVASPDCAIGEHWAFAMMNATATGASVGECMCCQGAFQAAPKPMKKGYALKPPPLPPWNVYQVEAWTTIQTWRPSNQLLNTRLGNYLSTVPGGNNFDLFFEDDGSGRQRFIFTKGAGNWYTIHIYGGCVPNARYLSATQDGSRVLLVGGDGGSGRERWVVERGKDDTEVWYYIRVLAGTNGGASMLTASRDGSKVYLAKGEDGGGSQRWVVEMPPQPAEEAAQPLAAVS
mmetsp:Transcript_78807/g.137765  ORF Transcript_78807/g.137765 Transcript_78807/m.137765 type:complete len:684 (+) Transcript_78807:2-2053(+)